MRHLLWILWVVLLIGCGGGRVGAAAPAEEGVVASMPDAAGEVVPDSESLLPVFPEDARFGSDAAPVTLLAMLDLECPFCIQAVPTLTALKEHYGAEKLRVVVKHHPLPFHPLATPAALLAIEVTQRGGSEAFFRFLDLVARGRALTPEKLSAWKALSLDGLKVRASTLPPSAQLGRDLALADRIGAEGTPAFFVNGLLIAGAQPLEVFRSAIDHELKVAEAARRSGKAPSYAGRVEANFHAALPEAPVPPETPQIDRTVWKVPVGGAPVLGPSDALVTIIEFSDYQCPYCKRGQATLRELLARYPADVRLVWKHRPLSFHAEARPAARLAEEARRRHGDAGFWKATDAILGLPDGEMDARALLSLAPGLGLDPARTRKAIEGDSHDGTIDADVELAMDVEARGTPHFFINGRRLAGAQPLAAFTALVDEELARAQSLVAGGVARSAVYDRLMESAEGPPPPPKIEMEVIPPGRPSRGARNAPVVILAFGDFQCPFCRRAAPTLDALLLEFPGVVRIVWMNLPLDFHDRAHLAAAAALEMKRRGGDAAFWKLHDLLMKPDAELSEEGLASRIKRAGGEPAAVLSAARDGRHDAAISEDLRIAQLAGIRGTPAFVVNGYLVSGAQPLSAFRRAVRLAQEDHRRAIAR